MSNQTKFQTMPLRFRVWDKYKKEFVLQPRLIEMYLETALKFDYNDATLHFSESGRFVISQDTGFKDKNGDSIFTGDIIRVNVKPELIGIVFYRDGLAQFKAGRQSYILQFWDVCHIAEVLGNIWQNPELLEKQHES